MTTATEPQATAAILVTTIPSGTTHYAVRLDNGYEVMACTGRWVSFGLPGESVTCRSCIKSAAKPGTRAAQAAELLTRPQA